MELQHIIKVEITKAETINLIDIDADLVRLIGVPQFTEIDIRKPAALVISTEKRDGVLVSDATLTFQTCERFLQKGEHYVFLATCADGTQYLLGRAERPYPTISTAKNLQADIWSSQLLQVTVRYSNRGYIPVVSL